MHISAGDDDVKFWKNASFFQKDQPDIFNKQHINRTEKSEGPNNVVVGDRAKIILQLLHDQYAVVLGSSYGDKNEIQHFIAKKAICGAKYRVLNENYLNSREKCVLKKVVAAIDNRDHCTFSDYQTAQKFALTVTHV